MGRVCKAAYCSRPQWTAVPGTVAASSLAWRDDWSSIDRRVSAPPSPPPAASATGFAGRRRRRFRVRTALPLPRDISVDAEGSAAGGLPAWAGYSSTTTWSSTLE